MGEGERAEPVRPEELAALRDGLADLLATLAESRTVAGWLRHLAANPIASAETILLLERCRDAFDALLQVVPSVAEEPTPVPAPNWLIELEECVNDATGSAPGELRARLRCWHSEETAERLESSAIELHIEFWDALRSDWMRDDSERAGAFTERFMAVLADRFGLSPFYPANFQDHPAGWVRLAAGNRMTTGRVREVLRPGLLDRDGELRVPARVNVE